MLLNDRIHSFIMFSFRPSVRPIPMTIHIQGFPGAAYCPRMATMNKPAYAAIKEHSPTKPTLIFVSSRRQTRLTALDLISYCAGDDNPRQFLRMPDEDISNLCATIRDSSLRDCLNFGVGLHHAGLDTHDRQTVEELFLSGKILVLVCTATLAWGVNLPCHLVIVKGTEFFDTKLGRYVDMPVTDVLQMMGRAGRPQFDDSGVACVFVHEPKKNFYKKFLHEPFPVESSLHFQLHEHINAEIAAGSISDLQDCVEFLSWTYYFRRLVMNPSYYGVSDYSPSGVQKHLTALLGRVLQDLKSAHCLEEVDGVFSATALGLVTAQYYLDYRTVGYFRREIAKRFPTAQIAAETNSTILCSTMQLLSGAEEFAQLPVRHNEDTLNSDLSERCVWPIDDGSFGSPHSKTFLLLQAFTQRIELPIIDYVTDTKSVLDQLPRVLNAAVDVSAEVSSVSAVLALAHTSQLVYQAQSPVTSASARKGGIGTGGLDELAQLPLNDADRESLKACGVHTLGDLHRLTTNAVQPQGQATGNGGSEPTGGKGKKKGHARNSSELVSELSKRGDLCRAVSALPLVDIRVSIESQPGATNASEQSRTAAVRNVEVAVCPWDHSVQGVHAPAVASSQSRQQVTLSASIHKQANAFTNTMGSSFGKKSSRNFSGPAIFAPKYHKSKTPSWWLLVTTATQDEVIALKKLNLVADVTNTTVQCMLPTLSKANNTSDHESPINHQLVMYLMCDCAFGIDRMVTFTVDM
jgi:hypothetical protein